MNAQSFKFYFDFSSPFGYLANSQVAKLEKGSGVPVTYHPILLGGLFKIIGTPMVPIATFSEPKRRYYQKDLENWSRHWGVSFAFPTQFPMMTVKPLRITLAILHKEATQVNRWINRVFTAYWSEGQNISDIKILTQLLKETGFKPAYIDMLDDPEIKENLKIRTSEAAEQGVCGVPTFDIDGMIVWGQDRIPMVEKMLLGWRPHCDDHPPLVVANLG